MMAEADRESFLRAANVSRETEARFDTYAALLRKWSAAINLVSPASLSQIWSRHFLDSAQIFSLTATKAGIWADLGSGAGFPGLVVAILATEQAPDLAVTLVESDARKAAFLSTVARETGISVRICAERIESLAPLNANILSARALAPIPKLMEFADRHLAAAGVALFPKGAQWRAELARARSAWAFDPIVHPSVTDPDSVVLEIKGARRV